MGGPWVAGEAGEGLGSLSKGQTWTRRACGERGEWPPRAGTALQQMREEAGLVPCPSSQGGLLAWLLRGLKFVVLESRTR